MILLLIFLLNSANAGLLKEFEMSKADFQELKDSYKRPEVIPYPKENQFSHEKFNLGKMLFFDPRLSSSGVISCATCHNPMFGWEDNLNLGLGHGMKKLGRHTPTILNLAWGEFFFWDGRAKTLEEQVLGPIASKAEMNMPLVDLEKKLGSIPGYVEAFKRTFKDKMVSKENVARAIATYERGIISKDSSFDQWIDGNQQAISMNAKRGFLLFNTKANCASCHSSWRFTDDSFHDIGIKTKDLGRYSIKKADKTKFAFKTPTLRNVTKRSPYMHNGSIKTLKEVINIYDRGGNIKRPSLSSQIFPLNLSPQDKLDILAFLKTLETIEGGEKLPKLPL